MKEKSICDEDDKLIAYRNAHLKEGLCKNLSYEPIPDSELSIYEEESEDYEDMDSLDK